MTQSNIKRKKHSQGGWTMIYMFILLGIICILGTVQTRMVITARRLSAQSTWGRSAEALADGAMEAALAHLEAGGQAGHLDIPLETGRAVADINPGQATSEFTVAFAGVAASDEKAQAERHYQGTASKHADGSWGIRSVRRVAQ
jgi:Tfp pilus assembly protein PilX